MNGKDIGTVEVTVKDGVIEKVIGKEEIAEFTSKNSQVVSNKTSEEVDFENSSANNSKIQENKEPEDEKQFNIIPVIIIVIIILIVIFIIIKKRRKR